jgi:hypothetical protein
MMRFVVLLLLCASCSSAKQEAGSLVAAVDRFHKAENVDKPARAMSIVAVVCTDVAVCDAKSACSVATRATADALVLKAEVEAKLAELKRGTLSKTDDAARALPSMLDEAGRLLEEGRRQMPVCDQKILALRGRYDL